MRFLWFSDTHVSDTPPVMRRESYTEDIFAKVEEIAHLCEMYDVDRAIFGGDWFNSKISSRISHTLVNKSLSMLDLFPCKVLFLVGSHDIPYGRADLADKRPIGILLRHPNVRFLDGPEVFGDAAIRLYAVSDCYNNTTEEVVAALTRQRELVTGMQGVSKPYYEVGLLHQPVVKGGSYPYPVVQAADLVGTADLILYGHMHNYEGIWTMTVGDATTTFVNVGAISRGVLDEKTLSRMPKAVIFDIDKDATLTSLEEIELTSVRPASEVFRISEKEEQLEREADIEALLMSVKATQFGVFSAHSAVERIQGLQYASREDVLPDTCDVSEVHFEAVKLAAVKILEDLGA